ncbi:hypothetical protein [Roseibacillus ishigakijimensis]|uniref:Uncharacterized protein n=1 Tax=Roseibacillus ishigakijimensis TaxID=454146 RepID=A0A934VM54_9BACT|nr:hypothetical protein [Roseibacillus ishigakijimensis]MBK1833600.1 hypothetical protein [Roseibacillus ishigakijimensis]
MPDYLSDGAKMSVVHLPRNVVEAMSGAFGPGADLTTTIDLGAGAPSNPFLHSYHPDHDNLDARFENTLPAGTESHRVIRTMHFEFDEAPPTGLGPSWGVSLLSGTFTETLDGLHKQDLQTQGDFILRKVSDLDTLIQP